MKPALYLVLHPSGIYHFRQKIPKALQDSLQRKVIKLSLRTRCSREALKSAWILASRYHAIFEELLKSMPKKLPTLEELLAGGADDFQKYEIEVTPGGGVKIKADDLDDHERAMEALNRSHAAILAAAGMSHAFTPMQPPQPHLEGIQRITIDAAKTEFCEWLVPRNTIVKTLRTKNSIVSAFVDFAINYKLANGSRPVYLDELNRNVLASWIKEMEKDNTLRTIKNKIGYVKEFFDWAATSGNYPLKDNPAEGHKLVTNSVKTDQDKNRYTPFTAEEIKQIFLPENLAKIPLSARWGTLIALYSGARVSEVSQLYTWDFTENPYAMNITDEGPGQKLKNQASKRAVALHPDLINLGLLHYVEQRKKFVDADNIESNQIFPEANFSAINGAGNWLSKKFAVYIKGLGIGDRKEKKESNYGFHSLRSTFIQQMQKHQKEISDTMRARIVGHSVPGEHFNSYCRDYYPEEQIKILPLVSYQLNIDEIKKVLCEE